MEHLSPLTAPDQTPIAAEPDDPAWLEARRTFIGASDVPAILGLSPWRTALDVWAFKVGLVTAEFGGSLATRLGHELEGVIARLWQEQHPDVEVLHAKQTVRHPNLPWLAASTDREVGDTGLLECKLVGGRMTHHWDQGPPAYVVAQVLTQLAVTGRDWCDVCSLHAGHGWDFRIDRVTWDADRWAAMQTKLDDFWHGCVITGERPELEGDPSQIRKTLDAAYPGDDSTPVVLPAWVEDTIADLKHSKRVIKDLEAKIKQAENDLIALMGNATDGFTDPNEAPVITYRPQQRTTYDTAKIVKWEVEGVTAEETATAIKVLQQVAKTTRYRTLRLR